VAVAWNGLGAEARYVGAVGDDEAGVWLSNEIRAVGLDSSHMVTLPGATGLTEISIDREGERQIRAEHFGVSKDFAVRPEEAGELRDVDWVHGALSPGVEDLVQAFRAEGRGISYDFSTNLVTSGLEGLDAAFYSWEGPPDPDTDALLESALQSGARLAVAMCGRYGSRVVTAEQRVSLGGNEIEVVDTCGAGDAFIANFVFARLTGAGLEASMRAGRAGGEQTCRQLGAWLNHRPMGVS
jgi:fructoselysine 6-kinase